MKPLKALYKQNQLFLILLMALAMLGLVAFQWYWIEQAIAIKRQQFDRNVMDALGQTVNRIERQELIFLAKQKLLNQEQKQLAANATAAAAAEMPPNKSKKGLKSGRIVSKTIRNKEDSLVWRSDDGSVEIAFSTKEMQNDGPTPQVLLVPSEQLEHLRATHSEIPPEEWDVLVDAQQAYIEEINSWLESNSLQNGQTSTGISLSYNADKGVSVSGKPDFSTNRAELMKDVFTDFMQGKRTITQRLNQSMLDSLLRQELKNKGIDLPFEYGVKNNGNLLFSSYALNYDRQLLSKAYHARLFPNDAEPQEQYLYVYFPKKEGFILNNLWSVFGTSFLLVAMIGGIFYGSINTIVKQKKLSAIKNDFISNMTHELKTPISTISLAVQMLKDDHVKKNPENTTRYLGIIQDENKRLALQVEKVLQMAQLDRDELKINRVSLDTHELIEQVVQAVSVQIEQRGGDLTLALEATNSFVEADEVHLANMLNNLFDNAVKYSADAPHLTLRTYNPAAGQLAIAVEDKGIGMNKEEMTRIFEKFYRVPTGNRHDVKGFGLGLSYVKKMMELHGGTVTVDSKPGQGTVFTLGFNG